MNTWVTMYTCYLNTTRTDQRSVFTLDPWRQLTAVDCLQLIISGVQAHSLLVTGESLHLHLKRIFKNIAHAYPRAPMK